MWLPLYMYTAIACLIQVPGQVSNALTLTDAVEESVYESVPLSVYHTYQNVWMFEYKVPQAATVASWTFKGINPNECSAKHIHVYIQHGSYPVISPLNESFPDNFDIRRTGLHSVTVWTNQTVLVHNLTHPLAGSWFAAAFLVEEDNDEVVQKITSKDCSYSLASNFTTVTIQVRDVAISERSAHLNVSTHQDSSYYRIFLSRLVWKYRIQINNCLHKGRKLEPCPVKITARSQALGNHGNMGTDSTYVDCSVNVACQLSVLQPAADQFAYVLVKKPSNLTEISFELNVKTYECATDYHEDIVEAHISTLCGGFKKLYRTSDILVDFAVTYALKPTRMEFIENVVTVQDVFARVFQFDVYPLLDSGGTLRIRVLFNVSNYSSVYSPEKEDIAVNVTVCILRGRIPVRANKAQCSQDNLLTLSSADEQLGEAVRYFPYPESGVWYLAMDAVCYKLVDSYVKIVACNQSPRTSRLPVKFDLKLSACVDGSCGPYGNCEEQNKGMYIFTSCNCCSGWRGYGCTDGSRARPKKLQLLDTMMLTTSNLLFLPGVVLAIYRRHYVEALVYFCNMFFSAFYHACDMGPWSLFTLCIMPYHVLSYCDFFCSIMSFWVTLMAMAELRQPFYSLSHMLGAVVLSMGVEWKQHGFIPYIIPISIGVVVVTVSWGYRRCYKKLCFARGWQWLRVVPGLVLAGTGMSIFGFVETDDNYPYTHSAWHVCMALCIVFFLPDKKTQDLGVCGDHNDSDVLELNDTDSDQVNLLHSDGSHLAFNQEAEETAGADGNTEAYLSRNQTSCDSPAGVAPSSFNPSVQTTH